MNTVHLLVCIVLAVPCGALVSNIAEKFVTERPLFQPSVSPRVSARTLAIGIVTMVVFLLLSWRFTDASWAELLAYLAGFAAVLLASVIDLTEYRLPDVVVLPSLATGVVLIASISIVDNSADRMWQGAGRPLKNSPRPRKIKPMMSLKSLSESRRL